MLCKTRQVECQTTPSVYSFRRLYYIVPFRILLFLQLFDDTFVSPLLTQTSTTPSEKSSVVTTWPVPRSSPP